MTSLLARMLVIAGVVILVLALIGVRRLTGQLPPGSIRTRWCAMMALIVFFVAGYLGYVAVFWDRHATALELIVPGIFFFGACFVWLTANLAAQTASALMRVGALEVEALRDPLTGTFNRRYLDRRLPQEVARASRYHSPRSVLLLDIDHFKRVNDEYGHPVGDQILVALAGIITRELRESDVFVRFGGEEFLVITPNTLLAVATEIAERLRKRVETHRFELPSRHTGGVAVQMSVSIGVATIDPSVASADALIEVADRNLYAAKHAGRNRINAGAPPAVAPDNER